MKGMHYINTSAAFVLVISALLLLAGCGGGGGLLADGGIIGTGTIIGTVPGTRIEAYAENGDYFETLSEINETDKHPFWLDLPADVGFYLVMIINEDTEDEVIMPIAFQADNGELLARIILRANQQIDLGHVPLYRNCSEVPPDSDPDADCILDKPFILNESQGSKNPLRVMDADNDGWNDFDDPDHGYGQQNGWQSGDPQDHDDDRVPNFYDHSFSPGPNDLDGDGINDDEDVNPGNIPGDDFGKGTMHDWNGQDMHPIGAAWQEQHGKHAESNLDSCATCHGDDFMGTSLSNRVGCYSCHNGPYYENDGNYGSNRGDGQNMHPIGAAWRIQHGEYAEHNLQSCAACHGNDFTGTSLSNQVGCYGCHNGPYPDDD